MELGQRSPPSLPDWLTQLHPGGVVLQESLSSKGTIEAPCSIPPCPSDIKYATIGIAVGFATSASFLALKICMIRKHLFDNDSSEQRSTNVGFNAPAQVIANSSNTESDTFPSICLLTLGNDFFLFCHQSG
ncbi:transmembrane protein 273 [Tursiops truncatus]